MEIEGQIKRTFPVLIGDIGGTNARLSIVRMSKCSSEEVKTVKTSTLNSKLYKDITELLSHFLEDFQMTENFPVVAVIGIPGPIVHNTIKIIANLDWPETKGEEVAEALKISQVVFLNDFVTNGYGILSNMKEGEDYIKLNEVPVDSCGPIAMIGAGTGLGHGYLVRNTDEKYYHVFPSEGGHVDFAPQTPMQWRYFMFLKEYYRVQRVSLERACAGPSIPLILNFLIKNENMTSDVFTNEFEVLNAKPEDIIHNGLSKKCKVCEKVLEFFVSIYAAAAGNISLLMIPSGGLYLLGGLSIALEDYILNTEVFKSNFVNKGRLQPMLENIPVFLVRNSFIGVKGAREYARRIIEHNFN